MPIFNKYLAELDLPESDFTASAKEAIHALDSFFDHASKLSPKVHHEYLETRGVRFLSGPGFDSACNEASLGRSFWRGGSGWSSSSTSSQISCAK